MSERDKELVGLDDLAAKLGENWDAVQILVSRTGEGGGTERYYTGTGNWYARQGMAHSFIKQDEAQTSAAEIGKTINPPEDE